MRFRTITDEVTEVLKDLKITHALFTTYNLDVSFFETEIIPLLFSKRYNFSNDARIKELQVREALSENSITLDLFYDTKMLKKEPGVRSEPMMEYGFIGIEHPKGAFHPKIIMVLGTTPNDERKLVVFAGSNNATRAGWWDNIETINSISLSAAHLPTKSLKQELLESLDYLGNHLYHEEQWNYATNEIKRFLDALKTSDGHFTNTHFFFGRGQQSFSDFIDLKLGSYITKQIISPYFPDDKASDLHSKINAGQATIFLPSEAREDGLHVFCSEVYFSHLRQKGMQWGTFSDSMKEIEADRPRMLHAKVFTFESRRKPWAFAGSVNFTYKAFHDNVEAGFLFMIPSGKGILTPIDDELHFVGNGDEDHLANTNSAETSLMIHLLYDWHPEHSRLYGQVDNATQLTISSLDGVELCVIKNLENGMFETPSNDAIRKHLEKSDFVRVSNGVDECDTYVMQQNWICKPLNYPDLTPQQVIHIYTSMNLEKRMLYFVQALTKKLLAAGEGTEYTESADGVLEEGDFFSEYAEIFYAFRQLKKAMIDPDRKSYYLYAERPDSINTLVSQLQNTDLDKVVKYLILLSAFELYDAGNIPNLLKNLLEEARASIRDPEFLKWFESEFFKEYKRASNEKS